MKHRTRTTRIAGRRRHAATSSRRFKEGTPRRAGDPRAPRSTHPSRRRRLPARPLARSRESGHRSRTRSSSSAHRAPARACTSSSTPSSTHPARSSPPHPAGQHRRHPHALGKQRGPVAVFDPQRLADGCPPAFAWSPVRGCEDPLTAMIRATRSRVGDRASSGGVESGGFWEGKTRDRPASAAARRRARRPHRPRAVPWSLVPVAAADAVGILASNPQRRARAGPTRSTR